MDDNIPHGLTGYRKYKCPCEICRAANAKYSRDTRARYKAGKPRERSNVTSINRASGRAKTQVSQMTQQEPQAVMGATEAMVVELERVIASGAPQNPLLIQMARAMARILDDQKQITQHVTCSRQLQQIIQTLTAGTKKKSKGRLARVTAMTTGKVAEQ